jgi:predicted deacetylase
MRYLLSIHDVWPGNFSLVEDYWKRLRSLGMGPAALLVVPQYHGSRPMAQEKEFLSWLAEKRASGSEIFLHGFRHLTAERITGAALLTRRSAWGRWINNRWVGHEAEFCGLGLADREGLLASGLAAFGDAVPLSGFVAPTWHGSPPRAQLARSGLSLWETRFRLHHLPSGKSRFTAPLAWERTAAESRLSGGRPWLDFSLRLPWVKVAIHPGDLQGREPFDALERVAAAGGPSTYEGVFA